MEKLLRIAKTKLAEQFQQWQHIFWDVTRKKDKKYRGDKKANRVKYKMIQKSNNRSI